MCDQFGNLGMRLHSGPGPLSVFYDATVDIRHDLYPPDDLRELPIAELPTLVLNYLQPSRYSPSDQFFEIASRELVTSRRATAEDLAICDSVRSRTRFQPVHQCIFSHTALDTLQNRTGVCRDFAHLTISICRALNATPRALTSAPTRHWDQWIFMPTSKSTYPEDGSRSIRPGSVRPRD